ncbi:MAG: LysR family transcriptional regulator [Acidaminococcaceae bacterium]
MNIQLFKSFLIVAECKNFTQAAQNLNFTQPAISNHITTLEKKYGVQLFQRDGKNVYLTAAGRSFCNYAQNIVAEYEESMEKMAGFKKKRKKLKIGVSTQFINYFLIDVLRKMHDKYADLSIEVDRCMTVETTLKATFQDKIYDLAFVHLDTQPLYTKRQLLWSQKIIWVVSPKMYEEHNYKDNIYEYPYIAYPSGGDYCDTLKNKIDFGLLDTQFSCSDSETVRLAVMKNLGIGLLPAIKIKEDLEEKKLIAFPLKYGIEMPVYLLYAQEMEITSEIKCFLELLEKHAKNI